MTFHILKSHTNILSHDKTDIILCPILYTSHGHTLPSNHTHIYIHTHKYTYTNTLHGQ